MRDTKGFTLIELLIVVAIILIIAAIAIPNLMTSFIRANESHAVDRLKRYAEAQQTFKRDGLGRIPANASPADGYAVDYRTLYYGVRTPQAEAADPAPLALLPKNFADAAVGPTLTGTSPSGVEYGEQKAEQGYLYLNPALPGGMSAEVFYADNFALVAVPELANKTGDHMYFISADGSIWRRLLDKGTPFTSAVDNPIPLIDPTGWEPY